MSRVRIGFVTETFPPEVNGVAHTVERFVTLLRDRGHEIDLVRPRQRHETADTDDPDNARLLRTRGVALPMYPDLRIGLARAGTLIDRWKKWRPELVHVATEGPLGAAAVAAAGRLGLPVTSDFRTNFHAYSHHYGLGFAAGLVLRWLRWFHNRTDRTFVPTPQMQAWLARQGFERLEVIGRGVDAALFSPARRCADLRRQWGAGPHDVVLLHVGRLAAEKNVDLALAAFRAAASRVNGARMVNMVIVGDGPLRARLQRDHPDALFVGELRGEALAAHYASADIFLFPSLTETFGNVVLEAMGSGLLVVAFDCAAANAHLRHGISALLAPPNDAAGFVDAVVAAATRLPALAALRQAARDTAAALNWEGIGARFEAALMQAAAGAAAAMPRNRGARDEAARET